MDQVIVNGIIVAVHETEPTVRDVDLARSAGLVKERDIRKTIARLVEDGTIEVVKPREIPSPPPTAMVLTQRSAGLSPK